LRTIAVACAVAVGAVAAAGAGAQTTLPEGGTLYGGGTLGSTYRPNGAHLDVKFVTARVSDDVKAVHFYGDLNSVCKGYKGAVTANFDAEVPLGADGTFTGSGTKATQAHAKNLKYDFSGKFDGTSAASGTASATFTFLSEGKSYPCASGTARWQARSEVKDSDPKPAPAAGALYAGNNEQTYPFTLRVAQDAKQVAQLATETEVKCTGKKAPIFYAVIAPPAPISADGAFVSTESWDAGAFFFGAGVKAKASQRVSGTFASTTASGTWKVDVVLTSVKTGKKTGSCTTGAVHWSASR
jgi:hypothetical protein